MKFWDVCIRIRGSIPLTQVSESGCGSCHFRQWPSRRKKKIFLCLFLFEGTFLSFFNDNKSSYYFCLMIEGSGSVSLTNGSGCGSGRPQKNMDPTDPDSNPDPQHCFHDIFLCQGDFMTTLYLDGSGLCGAQVDKDITAVGRAHLCHGGLPVRLQHGPQLQLRHRHLQQQGCGSGSALIWVAGSGFRSRRAKMTHKYRKK